jgi:hypothetical protein
VEVGTVQRATVSTSVSLFSAIYRVISKVTPASRQLGSWKRQISAAFEVSSLPAGTGKRKARSREGGYQHQGVVPEDQ